jgi:hypothetical protein
MTSARGSASFRFLSPGRRLKANCGTLAGSDRREADTRARAPSRGRSGAIPETEANHAPGCSGFATPAGCRPWPYNRLRPWIIGFDPPVERPGTMSEYDAR